MTCTFYSTEKKREKHKKLNRASLPNLTLFLINGEGDNQVLNRTRLGGERRKGRKKKTEAGAEKKSIRVR